MKIENYQRKLPRQKNDGASKNFSVIFELFIATSETNRDIISQNLTMGSIVIVVFFQISAKHCDRLSSTECISITSSQKYRLRFPAASCC